MNYHFQQASAFVENHVVRDKARLYIFLQIIVNTQIHAPSVTQQIGRDETIILSNSWAIFFQ